MATTKNYEKQELDTENKSKEIKLGKRFITDYIFCHIDTYSFKTWKKMFPDKKVRLRSLMFNSEWNEFFDIVEKKPYFKNMEKILSKYLTDDKKIILPFAELTFNSLNVLSPKNINVVFLGQDPYINIQNISNKNIPQAMGFSFSVPWKYPKPPSLTNIYDNLLQFKHLKGNPTNGCLAGWIMQGCFMINSSFTTFHQESNAHKIIWQEFTKDLITYLNSVCAELVFLAWGKDAHMLCLNVDPKKHHIITSSHPSPYAYNNTYSGYSYGIGINLNKRNRITYPPFQSTDHFGQVNQYLKNIGKKEIYWDIIN